MKKITILLLLILSLSSCAIPITICEQGPHLLPPEKQIVRCSGYGMNSCNATLYHWPVRYHTYVLGAGWGCGEEGGICFKKVQ